MFLKIIYILLYIEVEHISNKKEVVENIPTLDKLILDTNRSIHSSYEKKKNSNITENNELNDKEKDTTNIFEKKNVSSVNKNKNTTKYSINSLI